MASSCRPRIKADLLTCSHETLNQGQAISSAFALVARPEHWPSPSSTLQRWLRHRSSHLASENIAKARLLRTHVDRVTMREVAKRVWAHDGLVGFWAGWKTFFGVNSFFTLKYLIKFNSNSYEMCS